MKKGEEFQSRVFITIKLYEKYNFFFIYNVIYIILNRAIVLCREIYQHLFDVMCFKNIFVYLNLS